MKIKKLLVLSVFIITALLFIPNIVNAAEGDEFIIKYDNEKYQLTYEIISETSKTVAVKEYEMLVDGTTSAVIPQTVNNEYTVIAIGDEAFGRNKVGTQLLKSIVLPDTIETIGNNSFAYTSALTTIVLPSSLVSIGEYAFYESGIGGNITVPNTVETIGEYAFAYTKIKGITIPEKVNNIAVAICSGCENLESVSIKGNINKIGNSAFRNCKALTSFIIPSSVETIDDFAFYGTGLKTINLPSSVKTILNGAFAYSALESITIPNTVTNIPPNDVYHYFIFEGCEDLKTTVYPGSVAGQYIVRNLRDNITLSSNSYNVNKVLDNIKIKDNSENKGLQYDCYIMADDNYVLPESITISVDEKELIENTDYYYNSYNGQITVYSTAIKGDITINAIAKLKKYEIEVRLNNSESFDLASAGIESIELNGSTITSNPIQIEPGTKCAFKVNLLRNWVLQQINYNLGGTGSDTFEWTPTADGYIDILTRERNLYTLTFDANGGTGNMDPQTFTEGVEQGIFANTFTRDGYIFEGWNTETNGNGYGFYDNAEIIIDKNTTLYAQWKEKKIPPIFEGIRINFLDVSNIQDMSEEEMLAFRFILNKELFNMPDSEFKVYDKDGKLLFLFTVDLDTTEITLADGLTTSDNILYTLTEEDIQEYAQMGVERIPKQIELIFAEEVKTYKLILDANEGKFSDGKTKLEFEDVTKCDITKIEKPVKDGYTFKGWYTEKTGGKSLETVMNSEAGIDKDTTFYAQWEEIKTDDKEENTGNTNTGANNNTVTGNNPQTGDNIVLFTVISLIAVVGIAITIKVKKYVKE